MSFPQAQEGMLEKQLTAFFCIEKGGFFLPEMFFIKKVDKISKKCYFEFRTNILGEIT